MVPGTIALPVGLLMTGWAVQAKVHWIVPDIVRLFSIFAFLKTRNVPTAASTGIALVGAGIILNFQSIQIYIVDAFALYAASGAFRSLFFLSAQLKLINFCPCRFVPTFTFHNVLATFRTALASVGCLRSLFGFAFPLFAEQMYRSWGMAREIRYWR
jgi:hypothetical protein